MSNALAASTINFLSLARTFGVFGCIPQTVQQQALDKFGTVQLFSACVAFGLVSKHFWLRCKVCGIFAA